MASCLRTYAARPSDVLQTYRLGPSDSKGTRSSFRVPLIQSKQAVGLTTLVSEMLNVNKDGLRLPSLLISSVE